MRVAIIENTAITHHGQVGVALHEAAAVIDLYKPWLDGKLPKPDSFDALISFGGEQTALSDHSHPYLPDLAALLYDTALSGKATLGICLGAQAMARGAGAENTIGTNPEFGWCQIALTDQGRADPVLGLLPTSFPIFEWHADHFTLPPEAVHLATNPAATVQAYKVGRAGYATQFHFEASRAVVADWARRFPEVIEAQSPGSTAALAAAAERHGLAADAHGLAIARAWVALI
ncbi:type 1 glutamine amidotransferase [Cypionkella sp.]|uniref:type 1 glutamine amidotransferase n=1 Tax=Cypionkella sp. TaxID=2811411 RepID=UPI00271BE008|nr:type 1 glutamine amidotransferase [Cypionkella sp.]MDO8985469.1 type 1 glutamine amidotransferase [Cypionkella sp.]MDP2048938.1 type 1 glutamine amidotransferase [Cypionkella sp.]